MSWKCFLLLPDQVLPQIFVHIGWKDAVRFIFSWPLNHMPSELCSHFAGFFEEVSLPAELLRNKLFKTLMTEQSIGVSRLKLRVNSHVDVDRMECFANAVESMHLLFDSTIDETSMNNLDIIAADASFLKKIKCIYALEPRTVAESLFRASLQFSNLEELTISIDSQEQAVHMKKLLHLCHTMRILTIKQDFNCPIGLLSTIFDPAAILQLSSLTVESCKPVGRDSDVQRMAQACPHLHHLSFLHHNCASKLSGNSLEHVGSHCPNLRTLHFSDMEIYLPYHLRSLAMHCVHLYVVDVPELVITNDSLLTVSVYCPGIVSLTLMWAVSRLETVHTAAPLLSRLETLKLGCRYRLALGPAAAAAAAAAAAWGVTLAAALACTTALTTFESQWASMNQADVRTVVTTHCHSLRILSLALPDSVAPDELGQMLVEVADHNPLLEALTLRGGSVLPASFLLQAAHHLKNINHLKLYLRDMNVNDDVIPTLALCCPYLETVEPLSGVGLTDISLLALAQHSRRLSEIDLTQCSVVTENGLLALIRGCRRLATLQLPWGTGGGIAERLKATAENINRPPGCACTEVLM